MHTETKKRNTIKEILIIAYFENQKLKTKTWCTTYVPNSILVDNLDVRVRNRG